ncbi:autoinducer binding domain-containing protein [Variovorax sp. dw_954]|uniref:autoinducer binding domain-containing protein n=1 Tax=unclassified Variovorax TaxID=663243 RepID=UPI001BD4CBAD
MATAATSSSPRRGSAAGYLAIDPSVRHGQSNQSPILWDDALFASAETLWAEAKDQGLRHGWAQSSLDGFRVGGMLTLSRSSEVLTALELREKDREMRWLVPRTSRCRA